MMNERRRANRSMPIVQVNHYDGQAIFVDHELTYELGGYLGGGAAGVVYEAFSTRSKQPVAIKILNPVGYKLFPSALLARCLVAVRGAPVAPPALDSDDVTLSSTSASSFRRPLSSPSSRVRLRPENVWWLIHPTSKQAIAAFEDPFTGAIRELTLPQCMDVWGDLSDADNHEDSTSSSSVKAADGPLPHDSMRSIPIPRVNAANANDPADLGGAFRVVQVKGQSVRLPRVPRKFQAFAKTRRLIHREVSNMSGLAFHANVLQLYAALELVQDSKCTTFLVLELATGGELFDRIKLDAGTDEQTGRRYFAQLVSGVAFCHHSGVCHRDLKPENLLLADNDEPSVLKIADFGLSAIFASFADGATAGEGDGGGNAGTSSALSLSSIRRLRSVVGSPHYVAPEVLMDAGGAGYDGAKADAWSIGVILYAMLAGNLPFGKDLLTCLRYDKFRKWAYQTKYSDPIDDEDDSSADGVDSGVGSEPLEGNAIGGGNGRSPDCNSNGNGNADDPAADDLADKQCDVFPAWFFPARFSYEVKSLLAQLLYPDPSMRLSVDEARRHPWVLGKKIRKGRGPRRQQRANPNRVPDAVTAEQRDEPALFDMELGAMTPEAAVTPTSSAGADADASTKTVSPSSSFANRMNLAVDVPPFSSISSSASTKSAALDVEQLRMANRVDSSPIGGGFSYAKGNSPLLPRHSPASPGVAISPHYGHRYLARSPHPTGVALMPSVDETAPLSSPSSSSSSSNDSKQEEDVNVKTTKTDDAQEQSANAEERLLSPMDEQLSRISVQNETLTASVLPTPPVQSSSSPTETSVLPPAPATSLSSTHNHHHHHLHRFVSPPLASSLTHSASASSQLTSSQTPPIPTTSPPTMTSTSSTERLQYRQQRRNSPPELFLRGFDRACIKIQELSALDSLALSTIDIPTVGTAMSTTPTAASSSSALPTPSTTTSPPSYRDLVARSTRFLTTAPAPLVLARLEAILTADDANGSDCVAVDWEKFQLQLWRNGGARLVCTVQVFLYQRGIYLVEFRRGQVEIFQFKRFYEDVRAKMSESMESGGSASGGAGGAAGGGTLMPLRRRHKSISGNLYPGY